MGTRWSFLNTSESDLNAGIVTITAPTDVSLDALYAAEERRGVVRLDRWKLHDAIGIGEFEHATVAGIYGKEYRLTRYAIVSVLANLAMERLASGASIRHPAQRLEGFSAISSQFGKNNFVS